jgi:hypothetical protein
MTAVGALWGMFTKADLVDAGAEILVETITALPDALYPKRDEQVILDT